MPKPPPKTLRDRLELALDQAGATKADLARAVKVSRATVSDWLSGEIREIKAQKLIRAARFLRVRPEWLHGGEEPMRAELLDDDERKLLDLFRLMDDDGRRETLKYAVYQRTIANPVPDPPPLLSPVLPPP